MNVIAPIDEFAFLTENVAERSGRRDDALQPLRFWQDSLVGNGRIAVRPCHVSLPLVIACAGRLFTVIACEKSNAAHCSRYATPLRILPNRSTMPNFL